ncbi:MAG: epimerase [candidate division Zixibacteria bacterium SM23_81]|nr:MAG: epimerase [candidate division Zixibacteria bacterium SM23_81]
MRFQGVFITGGAGFIGSHLAERLLDRGFSVICLDNFDDYYDPQIKRENVTQALKAPNYKLVEGDIRDQDLLSRLLAQNPVEVMVHLAARPGVRPSLQVPDLYEKVNIQGTLNVLEMVRQYRVPKFLFGSSSSVYGAGNSFPSRETDRVDTPQSVYAVTKRTGELLAWAYHQLYGMSVGCLRFFTVYGPRQRPEMAIHKFTRLIWEGQEVPVFGDGSSERDYTYIDDIVDGLIAALEADFDFEIFNLGDSQSVPLHRMIALIEQSLSRRAQIKNLAEQPGDVRKTCAHIEKAHQLLGYAPKVPIEKGIPLFVHWFQKRQDV